jgi:proteasome component ECM29
MMPSFNRELCSVATDLGQPELVYKFLSLASHNAMWNSRKGAAFAAQALATSAAKAELETYLPSLVPKLYRYSYDPNPRVAQAMSNILSVLVSNVQSALDKYWDTIVAYVHVLHTTSYEPPWQTLTPKALVVRSELLEGMGSRMWRVREGCSAALGDAVQSRSMEILAPHLEQMFYMTFRVMDDIKETVRVAGLKCARSLATIAVRLCDVTYTPIEQATSAASIVLPFLLKKGVTNDSDDVRLVCSLL